MSTHAPQPGPSDVPRYRLGSQFILRMTGFPIEELQAINAPELAQAIDRRAAAERDRAAAQRELATRLDEAGDKWLARTVEKGKPIERLSEPQLEALRVRLEDTRAAEAAASAALGPIFDAQLARVREALYRVASSERFRIVLLHSSSGLEARLAPKPGERPPPLNSDARQRERTLTLFLQRLVTKNETHSFFGPSVYGKVDRDAEGVVAIRLDDREIAERCVVIEWWVINQLIELLAEDPEAQPHVPLRWADELSSVEPDGAELKGASARLPLTLEERAVLSAADATKPAGALGDPRVVASLIERKLLVRRLTLPFSPVGGALLALRATIAEWPEVPIRATWLARIDELERCRRAIEEQPGLEGRRSALASLDAALERLEVDTQRKAGRVLSSGRLPFTEHCRRAASEVSLGAPFVEQAERDLAPWYEFWRDLAGLYATRIHQGLSGVWDGLGGAPVSLARFLAASKKAGFPLEQHGGTGLCRELDAEIQRAWHEQLGSRAAQREVELTAADLSFLRRHFSFRRMRGFDVPGPDLQLIARDEAALAAGDWTMLLGEIHPDFTLWEEAFVRWCPDPSTQRDEHLATHPRAILYGHWDRAWDPMFIHFAGTEAWSLVQPMRADGHRSWRASELVVERSDDDFTVRGPGGEPLGSLVHTWAVALNTHQFELLGHADHTPRLRVGRAIVQRESWLVEPDEALRREVERSGVEQMVALRRLREARGLPEEAFIRPMLPFRITQHKDMKPVFVDFRSPLLLGLLGGTIRRFRRMRVVEMLPSSQQLWLRDGRGRYACEMRTAVRPIDRPAR